MPTCRILLLLLLRTHLSFPKHFFIEEAPGRSESDFFHVTGPESRTLVQESSNASRGLFGHSVAIFNDRGALRLLIGAPKRGNRGSVYSCDPTGVACTNHSLELPAGKSRAPVPDGGFLGGSVSAASVGGRGFLLFCDHLLVFAKQNGQASGLCNLRPASGSDRALPYDLCSNSDCLSGFSAAVRPSGANLLVAIGLPNTQQSHGQVKTSLAPPNLESAKDNSNTYLTPHSKEAYLTGFGLAFGHSMDATALFVSVAGLEPKVEVFINTSRPWTKTKQLKAPVVQGGIAGRFGFALATVNFAPSAGTKESSLLVGDPFYSVPKSNLTNAGAVYIFCRQNSKPSAVLVGPQNGGQFGFSLAVIGDVDGDRIPDFAVGCPYCDDGRGAVFVFSGQADCSPQAPRSILRQEGVQGFGWSLAGGEDFDKNGSPDLVVGAALSDAVFVAKSRPTLEATCRQEGSCRLFEESKKSCSVEFLFQLDFSANQPLKEIELTIRVDFDVHKAMKKKRMTENGTAVVLKKHSLKDLEKTSTVQVKVRPKLQSKLFMADPDTPIEWDVRILPINASSFARDKSGKLLPPPVLLATKLCSSKPEIKNVLCGNDKCVTDLRVHLEAAPGPLVFPASTATVGLRLSIDNHRKDALRTRARLHFRNGARFTSATAPCHEVGEDSAMCSLGNLEAERAFNLTLDLSAAWRRGWQLGAPPQLRVLVLSSNNDANETNNRLEVNFTAEYRPNITLSAHSDSNITVMDDRQKIMPIRRPSVYLRDIGPRLHHVYLLFNAGPSPALDVEVVLELPLWSGKKPLLYLLSKVRSERGLIETRPRVLGETGSSIGECQLPSGQMNPRNLTVREDYEDLTKDILHDGVDFRNRKATTRFRRRRRRRSISSSSGTVAAEPGKFFCPGPGCVQVRCRIPRLAVEATARVVLDAWLWSPTVRDLQLTDLQVQSRAWTWVGAAPPHLNLIDSFMSETLNTTTSFAFNNLKRKEVDTTPLIAMAVFIGCLLLFIMIFILYKCHFFERKQGGMITAQRVSKIEVD